jgi:hypothetical protein
MSKQKIHSRTIELNPRMALYNPGGGEGALTRYYTMPTAHCSTIIAPPPDPRLNQWAQLLRTRDHLNKRAPSLKCLGETSKMEDTKFQHIWWPLVWSKGPCHYLFPVHLGLKSKFLLRPCLCFAPPDYIYIIWYMHFAPSEELVPKFHKEITGVSFYLYRPNAISWQYPPPPHPSPLRSSSSSQGPCLFISIILSIVLHIYPFHSSC